MNLKPDFEPFGIGRHVAHADFAKLRWPAAKIRQRRPLANLSQFLVDDGAAAGGDDQTAQPLRMPQHIIVSRETAAGYANEMKAIEFEILHKGVKIIGNGAGLRTGGRIRRAAAPAAPIEGDNPISRRDETGNVVLPTVGVAGVSVEQHQGCAVPAAVGVPETHTR